MATLKINGKSEKAVELIREYLDIIIEEYKKNNDIVKARDIALKILKEKNDRRF